jgi:hypothetical protein
LKSYEGYGTNPCLAYTFYTSSDNFFIFAFETAPELSVFKVLSLPNKALFFLFAYSAFSNFSRAG